jgi:hypothetical protein
MHPTRKAARIAGAWYVAMGLVAPFSLLYVPNNLIVRGNAAATASRILGAEMLFRLGIAAELTTAVISIFMVMALYRLLHAVDKTQASLMVILGALVSVPITFLNVVNDIAALILLRGADFLSVFNRSQLEALAMLFLRLHGQGLIVVQIFWGLWLFPFGVLVIRSGFLPRILGVLLIVNGFAYVAISLASLLLPQYAAVVQQIAFPTLLGEVWIMLYLLIVGAKVNHESDHLPAVRTA